MKWNTFFVLGILMMSSALFIFPAGAEEEIYKVTDARTTMVDTNAGYFMENKGQWNEEIGFVGRTSFGHIGLNRGSVIYNVVGDEGGSVIRTSMIGANDASPVGMSPVDSRTNFFLGNDPSAWKTNVPSYEEVLFDDVWEGIDLIYYRADGSLKYDLVLEPFSDEDQITFGIEGHIGIRMDGDALVISTPTGTELMDDGLVAWYEDTGEELEASFEIRDRGSFSIELENRDPRRPVRIDPIVYSTLLGSYDRNYPRDLAHDSSGNNYAVGTTSSMNFPVTPGAYASTMEGFQDGFIFKMNGNGSSLLYATYFGGEGFDSLLDIEIDGSGNMYVSGSTGSSDFPTTEGAYNETKVGMGTDLFLFKMNPAGDSLIYSTLLGGSSNEDVSENDMIHVRSDGRVIIVGGTQSSDYPTTASAYKSVFSPMAMDMGVITVLSADGSSLVYSTFFGGDMSTRVTGMENVGDDVLYITGISNGMNFPVTEGAYRTVAAGFREGYVMRFNLSSYIPVEFGTYIGNCNPLGIAVGIDGSSYITGWTRDDDPFPTTEGAYDTIFNGENDIFVVKLKADGSDADYSTYIGGGDSEQGSDIEVDASGRAHICGYTDSVNYPYIVNFTDERGLNAYSNNEALVTVMSPDGSELSFSALYGSGDSDFSVSFYLTDNGDATILGSTRSTWFPTTDGAYEDEMVANEDIYLLRMNLTIPPSGVRGLTLHQEDGVIRLTWNEPLLDGGLPVTEYIVYRGDLPSLIGKYNSTPDTGYVDDNVLVGQKYYYKVSAINGAGESILTDMVSTVAVSRPAAPVNLRLHPGDGMVGLEWNMPYYTGELSVLNYRIYRDNGTGEPVLVAETTADTHEHTDTDVVNGMEYEYWMTTVNRVGESDPTDRYSTMPSGLPSEPLDLGLSLDNGTVVLKWGPPASDGGIGIDGYEVLKVLSDQGSAVIEVEGTTFRDRDVIVGEEYSYAVRALNRMGRSEPTEVSTITVTTIPSAPLSLRASGGSSMVTVEWMPPASTGALDLLNYRIYRGMGDGETELLAEVSSAELFYLDRDVINGLNYTYSVTVSNEMGWSQNSTTSSAIPAGRPSAPTAVTVTQSDGDLVVEWNSPDDNGGAPIISYRLIRSLNEDSVYFDIEEDLFEYVDVTAEPGVTYIYEMEAINRIGRSPRSGPVEKMLMSVPDAPVSLTAEHLPEGVRLTWDTPGFNGGSAVTAFVITRGVNGSFEEIDTVDGDTHTYTDVVIEPGVEYIYRVAAENSMGSSEPSEEASVVPTTVPGAPTRPVLSEVDGYVEVLWSAPDEEGGREIIYYVVERSVDGTEYERIATSTPDELSHRDYNIGAGKTYHYRVHAVNANGAGENSEAGTITTGEEEAQGIFSSISAGYIGIMIVLVLIVIVLLIAVAAARRKGQEEMPQPTPAVQESALAEGYQEGYDPYYGQQMPADVSDEYYE